MCSTTQNISTHTYYQRKKPYSHKQGFPWDWILKQKLLNYTIPYTFGSSVTAFSFVCHSGLTWIRGLCRIVWPVKLSVKLASYKLCSAKQTAISQNFLITEHMAWPMKHANYKKFHRDNLGTINAKDSFTLISWKHANIEMNESYRFDIP